MSEHYLISKILNNNVVFSKTAEGQDVILCGLGVGYQKKKGEPIADEQIERIFVLDTEHAGNQLFSLLKHVPIQYFFVAEQIKSLAEKELKKDLNENILVTLSDHIYYAIERSNQGLTFQNHLMWEIQRFYPEEYRVALSALDRINRELGCELPIGEASFLALHVINAETNVSDASSAEKMVELIKGITRIVDLEFPGTVDESSLAYTRFILHLKFFSQRLFDKDQSIDAVEDLFESVRVSMQDSYHCVEKIARYVEETYKAPISKSEVVYLTIHIQRLIHSDDYTL